MWPLYPNRALAGESSEPMPSIGLAANRPFSNIIHAPSRAKSAAVDWTCKRPCLAEAKVPFMRAGTSTYRSSNVCNRDNFLRCYYMVPLDVAGDSLSTLVASPTQWLRLAARCSNLMVPRKCPAARAFAEARDHQVFPSHFASVGCLRRELPNRPA